MDTVVKAILNPTRKFTEKERDEAISEYLKRFPSQDNSEILDKLTEREMAERILREQDQSRKRVQDIAREWVAKKGKVETEDLELTRKKLAINREKLPSGSKGLGMSSKKILLNKEIDPGQYHVRISASEFETMVKKETLPKMTMLTTMTSDMRRAVVRVIEAHDMQDANDIVEVSLAVWEKLGGTAQRVILSMYKEAPQIGTIHLNVEPSADLQDAVECLAGLTRGELLAENVIVTQLFDTEDNEVFGGVFEEVGMSQVKVKK